MIENTEFQEKNLDSKDALNTGADMGFSTIFALPHSWGLTDLLCLCLFGMCFSRQV